MVNSTKKTTKKETLWIKCCEAGLITGDTSVINAKGYLIRDLEKLLADAEASKIVNTKNKKEGNEMKKQNSLCKGTKMVLKVKDAFYDVEVVSINENNTITVKYDNGTEKNYLANIIKKAFENQTALIEERKTAPIVEKKEKPSTSSKSSNSNKYWENETPLLSQLDYYEIRNYEEAGRLQIFQKVDNKKANDGSKLISRGITINTGDLTEEEAMKFISNVVYAMKDRCFDERLEKAIEILEDLNQEINPDEYVFTKKELEPLSVEKLTTMAKKLGILDKKNSKSKATIITALVKYYEEANADEEEEE